MINAQGRHGESLLAEAGLDPRGRSIYLVLTARTSSPTPSCWRIAPKIAARLSMIDLVDAALRALAAHYAARGDICQAYGEPETGYIVVPDTR